MSDPAEAARRWREERFRRRVDTLVKTAGVGTMGGHALVSPLPPGRGSHGTPVDVAPPPAGEIVAVVADQEVSPTGTFLTWRAVSSPPARVGFDYLELPSDEVVLTLAASYTVSVEVDWHQGQGGVVEIWVAGNRHHVAQTGRTGNVTTQINAPDRLAALQVRTRHGGDSVRVSAKLTVELGSNLPQHNDDEAEEEDDLPTLPAPGAPAAIPGTELGVAHADLSWNTVEGAERFEVQVAHVELGYFEQAETDGTDVRVGGLEPLTDYVARVRAAADGAISSPWSDDTPFSTPADETIPEPPAGVEVTAALSTVTVSWDENREHDVAGGQGSYRVELAEVDESLSDDVLDGLGEVGDVVGVQETAGTIVAFRGLERGRRYAARLQAVDSSGNESDWSGWVVGAAARPLRNFLADPVRGIQIMDGTIEAEKIAANAIEAGHIGAQQIVTEHLTAGIIASDHIVTAGLDAAVIRFGSMSGNRIEANTLDVNRLTTSTLTSRTITLGSGGVLRAPGTSGRFVEVSSNGFRAWDGSQFTVDINENGQATFRGSLDAASGTFSGDLSAAGGTFTGTLSGGAIDIASGDLLLDNAVGFRIQVNRVAPHIEWRAGTSLRGSIRGSDDGIMFYGTGGSFPGHEFDASVGVSGSLSATSSLSAGSNSRIDTHGEALRIGTGAGSSLYFGLYRNSNTNRSALIGHASSSNPHLTVKNLLNNGHLILEAADVASGGRVESDTINDTTGSISPNLFIQESTSVIGRNSSSLRYKTDVRAMRLEEAYRTLTLEPIRFRGTGVLDDPDHTHYGYAAEEVAERDPRLAVFGPFGDGGALVPDNVQYDRFVPHHGLILAYHENRIRELERRLGMVDERAHALPVRAV